MTRPSGRSFAEPLVAHVGPLAVDVPLARARVEWPARDCPVHRSCARELRELVGGRKLDVVSNRAVRILAADPVALRSPVKPANSSSTPSSWYGSPVLGSVPPSLMLT